MASDIKELVRTYLICQAKKKAYLPPASVNPLPKGLAIWNFVSVDLIEIRATDDVVKSYVMCCICAYSKCPELIPIPNRRASTTRDAFRE